MNVASGPLFPAESSAAAAKRAARGKKALQTKARRKIKRKADNSDEDLTSLSETDLLADFTDDRGGNAFRNGTKQSKKYKKMKGLNGKAIRGTSPAISEHEC